MHDCNVNEAFSSVNDPSNTKVLKGSNFGMTPMDTGGFGAQLCKNKFKCTTLGLSKAQPEQLRAICVSPVFGTMYN